MDAPEDAEEEATPSTAERQRQYSEQPVELVVVENLAHSVGEHRT